MQNSIVFKTDFKKVHKSNRWKSTIILLTLGLMTRIILHFAAKRPYFIERFYSATIYPHIASILGFISNIVPFSIAEAVLIILALFIIYILFLILLKPKLIIDNIQNIFQSIVNLAAIVYILFYFLWGFNYYRQDYSVLANMNIEPVMYVELKELTLEMIDNANKTRESLLEDKNGVFIIEEDLSVLGEIANKGFDNYTVGNFNLGGNYGPIKPVFLSKYMSYTGIAGIYIPFTSEPTINVDIPYQSILSTISHEIAHQRGFAKEDEANFIAYKANIRNPDKRFQYSGYYLAMSHLMNEIYRESPDDYFALYSELSDAVKRDMNFARDYWASKEGRLKETAATMNDNYLKANNQADGVKSYSGVVDLLLAEYKLQK